MAELRVRVLPDHFCLEDAHGHPLPFGIEVLIYHRDGPLGSIRWNEPPLFGCSCPYDDVDPDCPYSVLSGDYAEG